MKIRSNYVSNSSSSSFICDVCGRAESGYDLDLSDIEMYEYECGHTTCWCEINKNFTLKQWLEYAKKHHLDFIGNIEEDIKTYGEDYTPHEEMQSEYMDLLYEEEGFYEVPKFMCPICNLNHLDSNSKYEYLLHKFNLKDEDVINEIKSKFNALNELEEAVK
jgi:hypothetical protein